MHTDIAINQKSLAQWNDILKNHLLTLVEEYDIAHSLDHFERVVGLACLLAKQEDANLAVVLPAAWLHDCVPIAKTDPRRKQSSQLSAEQAAVILNDLNYDADLIPDIQHAILTHSFSANITPETLEAKVVQDADRLDALGSIGIARCLMLGTTFGSKLYNSAEPIPVKRKADDKQFIIDHFYTKLLSIGDTLQTASGRAEGKQRITVIKSFIAELNREIHLGT